MSDAQTLADDYADDITEELRHLDTVLDCRDHDGTALAALELDDVDPDDGTTGVLIAYLNGSCLEMDTLRSDTKQHRTFVEVLRTTGGPCCIFTRESDDGATVELRVYWGTGTATRRLTLPALADHLDELAQ
jgi:hypothetical protein